MPEEWVPQSHYREKCKTRLNNVLIEDGELQCE